MYMVVVTPPPPPSPSPSLPTALSVTVSILLRSFSDIIDAISVARETAIVISSRQYLSTQVRVQLITREVVQTLEMADRFVGLAQTNHQHMGQVADSLMGVGELLVKAGNLVQEVVSRANSTEEFVRQAEFVEQEIMVSTQWLLSVTLD